MFPAKSSWCRLEPQLIVHARNFAALNAGRSNAAKRAMMAMTTRSSISVKPFRFEWLHSNSFRFISFCWLYCFHQIRQRPDRSRQRRADLDAIELHRQCDRSEEHTSEL